MPDVLLEADRVHLLGDLSAEDRIVADHRTVAQPAALMLLQLRGEGKADIDRDTVGDRLQRKGACRRAHAADLLHDAQQQGDRAVGVHAFEQPCRLDHRRAAAAVVQRLAGNLALQQVLQAADIGDSGADGELLLGLFLAHARVDKELLEGRVLVRVALLGAEDAAPRALSAVDEHRRGGGHPAVDAAAAGHFQKAFLIDGADHQADLVDVRLQHHVGLFGRFLFDGTD